MKCKEIEKHTIIIQNLSCRLSSVGAQQIQGRGRKFEKGDMLTITLNGNIDTTSGSSVV